MIMAVEKIQPGQFSLHDTIELHCELSSSNILPLVLKAGLKFVVIKWPIGADSAPVARFLNTQLNSPMFCGGVVLDRPLGGINPAAVKCSARRGGKFVWMPTEDALHHRRINNQSEEGAVHILNERGALADDVKAVLDEAARFNLILGTGHISPMETELLIEAAVARGVRRIVVNHPLFLNHSLEQIVRIAKYPGVFIEHCYVPDHKKTFDLNLIIQAIQVVGPEKTVIADFGTFGKRANIADALMQSGMSVDLLTRMTRETPAELLSGSGYE